MVDGKKKFSLFVSPEAREMVTDNYKKDNCVSQSEYVEKAIRFYTGYLNADSDGSFLPTALSRELDGKLSILAKRIGRMLFKLAVDQAAMCNLVSYTSDVSLDQLRELLCKCAQDVKRTNGEIDLEDAYKFQKDVE